MGTEVTVIAALSSTGATDNPFDICYSPTDETVVMIYQSDRHRVKYATVSGTTITWNSGSYAPINSAGNTGRMHVEYSGSSGKINVIFEPGDNSIRAQVLTYNSGSDYSLYHYVDSDNDSKISSIGQEHGVAHDANTDQFVLVDNATHNNNYNSTFNYSDGSVSTNVTAENYIGTSSAAYANSATATINVSGSLDSNQSSLTPGQKYYVQNDGTLGLTAASPKVFAGTAVAATKLLVNDQQPASATPVWELITTDDATGESEVENKGWSNTYSQYKLVIHDWSATTSGSTQTGSKIQCQFYFDATSGNDGTLITSSDYKYQRTKILVPGTSTNPGSNGSTSQTKWSVANDEAAYSWNGEFIFPMFQEGGWGQITKIVTGEVTLQGYENNVQRVGCYVNNTTALTQHLTGAKFTMYNTGGSTQNATRGKFSWYRLRM